MIEAASARAGAPHRAIVVMGVSASGKTSAGEAIAARFGLDFVDGDDLHPVRNVEKMAGGTPLTDEDRWPWLDRIGAVLADKSAHPAGVVVACSALRRVYRQRIRVAAGAGLSFVFLDVGFEEATRRIAARKNHYMPPSLIESQFQTLERPDGEPDVVPVTRLSSVEDTADQAENAIRARDDRQGAA